MMNNIIDSQPTVPVYHDLPEIKDICSIGVKEIIQHLQVYIAVLYGSSMFFPRDS